MPVPDQVQDDGSGIQNSLNLLDSGFRRNDAKENFSTFYETINIERRILMTLRFIYFKTSESH
jgi:hypothetical protein